MGQDGLTKDGQILNIDRQLRKADSAPGYNSREMRFFQVENTNRLGHRPRHIASTDQAEFAAFPLRLHVSASLATPSAKAAARPV